MMASHVKQLSPFPIMLSSERTHETYLDPDSSKKLKLIYETIINLIDFDV